MRALRSRRFEREVAAAIRWGRENRGATTTILYEIERLADDVEQNPAMYALAENARTPGLRRAYLPRIGYHVFYTIDETRDEALFLHFRHAKRRPAKL